MDQYIRIAIDIIGLIGIVAGVAAKWLPEGKAKAIARDVGFRAHDALGVIKGAK